MSRMIKMSPLFLLALVLTGCSSTACRQSWKTEFQTLRVEAKINAWHQAAALGMYKLYFDAMTDDAVFMGTDASERWGKGAFMEYAREPFADGHGWTYVASDQHVAFSADRRTAWIDEVLAHETYGTLRGTGVLVKVGDDWKIAQYSLTFLVPNEKAGAVVGVIGGE